VCTRGRPAPLARLLASVSRMRSAPREVIVVDNDPASGAARAVVEAADIGARLVPEPRPGLSVARNTGVRAAAGEIVAFTDDDVEVHPDWLWRLAEGFTRPSVAAVTGLVLPADLTGAAQMRFERGLGGFGAGFRRIEFGPAFVAEWSGRGVPVWHLGAGANMAVRREAFRRVGLFDERLGAGAAGCSEDSELWYRLLAAGGECRYRPWAVVTHHHRDDEESLRRLARDYARGHTAALLVSYRRHGNRGELVRALFDMPRHFARRAGARVAGRRRPESDGLALPAAAGYAEAMLRPRRALASDDPPRLEAT
jgi:GT2 family glycosyltransferase